MTESCLQRKYFFSVNDACLNFKIFICLPYYLWLFPFFLLFWQTVSDKKMINLSIFVFLCTLKPEHVYVTIYVKSWSINNFLSKNLLLPTVCLILFWELIPTLRDGLNLLTLMVKINLKISQEKCTQSYTIYLVQNGTPRKR